MHHDRYPLGSGKFRQTLFLHLLEQIEIPAADTHHAGILHRPQAQSVECIPDIPPGIPESEVFPGPFALNVPLDTLSINLITFQNGNGRVMEGVGMSNDDLTKVCIGCCLVRCVSTHDGHPLCRFSSEFRLK